MSAFTYPSVAIATYLTFTAKRWGQFPTITFTNGASAGHEVVTVDSSNNLFVQIESGVSTNLQIKNAVLAHVSTSGFNASDLVSVSITTGHNTDTQVTCVNAPLAGGVTSSVKAQVSIGGLLYKAQSAGTSGNSIRIKYTSGASLSVSVSTNDITVQLKNDGTSTNELIAAAVAASSPANALVSVVSAGPAMDLVPLTDAAPDFVSLSGGLTATAASLTNQGITITSGTNDSTQNGLTFTLSDGATAGSEVVTVDTSGNVTCQAQIGTSTVTQIRTALNSASAFSALYTATGTASTTPTTVNQKAMSGAVAPDVLGFFLDNSITALTSSFVYFPFAMRFNNIVLNNDETSGTKQMIFSWDGINNHGILDPGESVSFLNASKGGIFLKYGNAAPAYRVFATS